MGAIFGRAVRGCCGAVVTGLLLARAAEAQFTQLTFCNQYQQTIFVAVAYQQSNQTWLSRGWLEIKPNDCEAFDSALSVQLFYYRAETNKFTDPYTGVKGTASWGNNGDRKFAVTGPDFNFYDAQRARADAHLAGFLHAAWKGRGHAVATVTFATDGAHLAVERPQ
jgi:uncharacterized membrane protein